MFGFPRLKDAVGRHPGGGELIDRVLDGARRASPAPAPSRRTTSRWSPCSAPRAPRTRPTARSGAACWPSSSSRAGPATSAWPSTACAQAVARAADSAPTALERLGTAVGEATMNAMEHGNGYRDDRPVTIRVVAEPDRLRVRDHRPGRRAPRAGRRGARPRGEARGPPAAARLGAVPDRAHGGRDARDRRRPATTRSSCPCAWEETAMTTRDLEATVRRHGRRRGDRPARRRRRPRRGGARPRLGEARDPAAEACR